MDVRPRRQVLQVEREASGEMDAGFRPDAESGRGMRGLGQGASGEIERGMWKGARSRRRRTTRRTSTRRRPQGPPALLSAGAAVNCAMTPSSLRLVRDQITRAELDLLAKASFGEMVKAVVDVERRTMAVGGELHSDEEAMLLDDGSTQSDLWGINLYTGEQGDGFIEFDSMINVRPAQGNPSRSVMDASTRARLRAVVTQLVAE